MKLLQLIKNIGNVSDGNLLRTCLSHIYLTALCLLCYGHALNGAYVFDDRVAIIENAAVNTYPTNFTGIIYNDFWGNSLISEISHKSYRPLITFLFHYEYAIMGLKAYHMKYINLFIHIINTILLWHWLEEMHNSIGQQQQHDEKHEKHKKHNAHYNMSSSVIALLASSFFAIHPIHTEAVCGIVSRADLMCCLMFLIASMMTAKYCLYKKHLCLLACLLTTIIGILIKETAITIPLMCIFVEYVKCYMYKLPTFYKQFQEIFLNKHTIFYMGLVFSLMLWRLWWCNFQMPHFEPADNPAAYAEHFTTRLLTQHYIYVKNFQIQLLPTALCFDWAFDCIPLVRDFTDYRCIFILLMYCFLLWPLRNFHLHIDGICGIALCVIPFLPASGIIPVGFVIAERVLYIPSIGFYYLIACGYIKLITYSSRYLYMKEFLHGALAITIICLIMRCRQRANQWLSEESLFNSALEVCPNNAKVHYNIGRLAVDYGNFTKAFHHYNKAIELYPAYEAALMNIGNLYREIGDMKSAQLYLEKVIELNPKYATAWMNLGVVHATARNYSKALKCYETALNIRPNYANCHYNLGNMYVEQNQYQKALYHWKYAVHLKPGFVKAWINILTLLDTLLLYEDALKLSDEALMLHPNDAGIMLIRANVLGKLAYYEKAEILYLRIIQKDPHNYLYHTNLGVLYHRWHNFTKAIQHYNIAIASNQEKAVTAKENLSKIIKQQRISRV